MTSTAFLPGRFAVGLTKRRFLAGAAASTLISAAHASVKTAPTEAVTPEMFGAKGDGRSNDTNAFSALSQHVNSRGGGTIFLRPVTYIVGAQHPSAAGKKSSFEPSPIIHLAACTRPVRIQGNGARLRAAPGLRYGRFDRVSGEPLPDAPKLDTTDRATPYLAMILIEKCSAPVELSDLELDGNLQAMIVGGRSFRGGWEALGSGIRLVENVGSEHLSRIDSHHHPLDGLYLIGSSEAGRSTKIADCSFQYNGRQGCSITGGSNFSFESCKFSHTGRAGFGAAPGAGVDVESEFSPIRNVSFSKCEFVDNKGFGLVAGSGDSAEIRSDGCKFIGTNNLSVWPDKPFMSFSNCLFVGAINHVRGDEDPAKAAQFVNCTFTDDPKLSPNGKVFLPHGGHWLAVIRGRPNVHFKQCHFRAVADGLLPLSDDRVIYEDCAMSQRSPKPSSPIGTYLGTNTIRGNARLENSKIRGKVVLNDRTLPAGG
jgi:hypothetical protein